MNIKRKFMQFAKSFTTLDFRTDAQAQKMADIKRKAARFETLKHTAGKASDFGAAMLREDINYMQMFGRYYDFSYAYAA
jgi:hypothetical protein